MREKLNNLGNDARHRFIGKISRFGTKSSRYAAAVTICLVDVRLCSTNELMTDHLWITEGKTLEKLNLHVGDIISFDARVDWYLKGYLGKDEWGCEGSQEVDCKLSFPTNIKVEYREVDAEPYEEINEPIEYKIQKDPDISFDSVMSFGKHEGKTLRWIFENDIGYLAWMKNDTAEKIEKYR